MCHESRNRATERRARARNRRAVLGMETERGAQADAAYDYLVGGADGGAVDGGGGVRADRVVVCGRARVVGSRASAVPLIVERERTRA